MDKKTEQTEIIIFKTDDKKVKIDVRLEDSNVWLTQEQIASLFEKGRSTIAEHIQNAFKEGEVDEIPTYHSSRSNSGKNSKCLSKILQS